MSIKADHWIRRMAEEEGLIDPFEPNQISESEKGRVISYGTSSYGYDVRCSDEFKVFTNIHSAIVDPKNFDDQSFVDLTSDVCIIPPNSFAREHAHRSRFLIGVHSWVAMQFPLPSGPAGQDFPSRAHPQTHF